MPRNLKSPTAPEAGDLTGLEAATPNAAEGVTQSAPRANYIAVNLTTRGGIAYGINDLGQVVGNYLLPSNEAFHGFLWKDRVLRDIGTLGGTTVMRPRSMTPARWWG